jgi:multiple sugar transport system substrate-binding protein
VQCDRKTFLKATTLSVFGVGHALAGLASAASRYAPYRGQTVSFCIPDHPHYDAMLQILPEFTRETGIKVDVQRDHLLRLKPRQLAELDRPQNAFDLICYVVMWKSEYVKKGLIQELTPFLNNPRLADPDYDMGDLVKAYVQNIGLVGGHKGYLPGPGARLYGLPYGAETSVLAYRKDVFSKLDLQVPTTYTELKGILPLLREKAAMPALASRGQSGHNCVHAWLLHLNPMGGKVFDAAWRPQFHNAQGVQALDFLRLVAQTGSAFMPTSDYGEALKSFLTGECAMYLDSTAVFGAVKTSTYSRVEGRVSYALHPKGVRMASQSGGFGLAITGTARNADAAFLLMQWLTSKAQDKAVCRHGGGPVRMSTVGDADMVRMYPEYILLKEQLRYADPDWRPIIAQWDEINTGPLGAAVHQGLTGAKSSTQALRDIVPRVNEIMKAVAKS